MGRFRTIDMDAADMDAVERAFEADERQELRGIDPETYAP